MLYRRDLIAGSLPFTIDDVRRKLKGKDLVCWCKLGAPCHADVLLAVANGDGWGFDVRLRADGVKAQCGCIDQSVGGH
jgi:hypothetical protein